jgi:hypothetical protein
VGPGDYDLSGNMNKKSYLDLGKRRNIGFLTKDKRFRTKLRQSEINEMIQNQLNNPKM